MAKRTHNQNTLLFGSQNGICDDCGFQFKQVDLRKRWDGLVVCRDCWEPQHPSDLYDYRSRDNSGGAGSSTRPDDAGTETGTSVDGSSIPPPLILDAYIFTDQETLSEFSHTFTFSGAPYVTFSVTSGALPSGTTLEASTGVVSGTLTTSETATFTLQIEDSLGNTDTEAFSIVINESYEDLVLGDSPVYYFRYSDPDNLGINSSEVAGALDSTDTTDVIGDAGEAEFNGATSTQLTPTYTAIEQMADHADYITTEFWITMSPTQPTTFPTVVAKGPSKWGGGAGSKVGWRVYIDTVNFYVWHESGGTMLDERWHGSVQITPSERTHVVMTHQPSNLATTAKCYINGVLDTGTYYFAGDLATNYTSDAAYPLTCGYLIDHYGVTVDPGDPENFLNGTLDEVAGYTYELSAAQVLAHYNAGV